MNQTTITVSGNLTRDPELRFTASGTAVCRLTVADTPRFFDRTANEWKDGETTFWPVTVWGRLAEHAAATLAKGLRVLVVGTVKTDRWTDDDDNDRERITLTAIDLGPSLTYATATVTKSAARRDQGADPTWDTASRTRPAATPEPAGVGASGGFDDKPPF
ncbi:single-stranded DNA-binding protein [Streptomyces sp. NPDC127197]|uniref:single-stranded DNA-binding protein n=1 Tax=Streptomyces sp. NPDC127197 TaxID=3345388 RepID=UPI003627AB4C